MTKTKTKNGTLAKKIALKEITKDYNKNYIYIEKKVLDLCSQPKRIVSIFN